MNHIAVSSADQVLSFVQRASFRRIGLDGMDGVGKSTLAKVLGAKMNYPVVGLDDYLERERGGYIDYLRYDELQIMLDQDSFIVEGVCLLEAIERIGCKLDLLVYLKLHHHGVWRDAGVCEIDGDPRNTVERKQRELADFAQIEARLTDTDESQAPPRLPELSAELIHYHAKYRPQHTAGLIYQIEGLRG